MYSLFVARSSGKIEPCNVDREIDEGGELPIAGRLMPIQVLGQCAGQLALLWSYENLQEGLPSLRKIASFDFDVGCFGHGDAVTSEASARFRQKWGAKSHGQYTA